MVRAHRAACIRRAAPPWWTTVVYFAYEVIAESGRASLVWVFVINLPWTLSPILLVARLGFLRSGPKRPVRPRDLELAGSTVKDAARARRQAYLLGRSSCASDLLARTRATSTTAGGTGTEEWSTGTRATCTTGNGFTICRTVWGQSATASTARADVRRRVAARQAARPRTDGVPGRRRPHLFRRRWFQGRYAGAGTMMKHMFDENGWWMHDEKGVPKIVHVATGDWTTWTWMSSCSWDGPYPREGGRGTIVTARKSTGPPAPRRTLARPSNADKRRL